MSRIENSITMLVFILVLALVGTLPPTNDANSQIAKKQISSILKAEPNAILVMSVPSGLKVYFGPDNGERSDQEGFVPIKTTHPIITQKYFKGVTPLLIRNVKPGNYLLGIAPLKILDRNCNKGNIDETLTEIAMVSSKPLPIPLSPPLKEEIYGAIIYSINRETKDPQRVIVIAVPQNASLTEMDFLYPVIPAFQFDESMFLKELKQRTKTLFTEDEHQKIIKLLSRGGKIILTTGDIKLVSEITLESKWTIETYLRKPKGVQ
jgi:hypothetical protein